jgi:hypothetical protein
LSQRLADWQETPKWHATLAGASPWSNRVAAFSRQLATTVMAGYQMSVIRRGSAQNPAFSRIARRGTTL